MHDISLKKNVMQKQNLRKEKENDKMENREISLDQSIL